MHELMHHTRADATPYPEQECEIYVAVREGRPSHVSNEVLWRTDGTSFAAEYWSYPMYKAGEMVGPVVTFLDISDRKRAEEELRRSEQQYRQLFENATYGMFWSKPDGTLLDVNPAIVAMLGYCSRHELRKRDLNFDIYEDESTRRAILESYGPSERVEGVEAKWQRKDGKTIVVRISGNLIREKNGSIDHYEVIAEDITERRSLEEQLRQSQKLEAVGLLPRGFVQEHDFGTAHERPSDFYPSLHARATGSDQLASKLGVQADAGPAAIPQALPSPPVSESTIVHDGYHPNYPLSAYAIRHEIHRPTFGFHATVLASERCLFVPPYLAQHRHRWAFLIGVVRFSTST